MHRWIHEYETRCVMDGVLVLNDERWITDVWSKNVRVAVLYDNESSRSELNIDYSAVTINKAAEDSWIVFPWEDWWQR